MSESGRFPAPRAPVLVVAAALIDENRRVLLQRRPLHRQHGGLWEFPGGKVEAGEGARGALVRELAEELGLHVVQGDLFEIGFAAADPGDHGAGLVLLLFGCRRWRGIPVAEPGAALAWPAAAELADFAMPPLDVPLARALVSRLAADDMVQSAG